MLSMAGGEFKAAALTSLDGTNYKRTSFSRKREKRKRRRRQGAFIDDAFVIAYLFLLLWSATLGPKKRRERKSTTMTQGKKASHGP